MIEKQPYEKHLTNELEQLPPMGDAAQHWPDMKARLDREMPEGGAWFSGWRRWGGLLLLCLFFLSGWWYLSGKNVTPNTKAMSHAEAADPSSVVDTKSSPPITGDREEDPAPPLIEKNTAAGQTVISDQQHPETAEGADISGKKENGASSAITVSKTPSTSTENASANVVVKTIVERPSTATASLPTKQKQSGSFKRDKMNTTRVRSVSPAISTEPSGSSAATKEDTKPSANLPLATDAWMPSASKVNAVSYHYSLNAGLLLTDSMPVAYSASINAKLKPTPKRSRFKEVTERTQKLHNREVGAGDAKKFVFGLALPLAFPISDQKAVAYNFNGGQNTVSDYFPTPHVQYHFGKESFLQAEMQFINPQFIRPALLSQLTSEQTAPGNNRYVTTSIFAKKLYYFNLPVSVYYSPFKNFYLGTGLQFSSLLSGIAYSEYRAGNSMMPQTSDTLLRYSYSKFRNDTLSGRLNSNEFRVLLDAQYYWKRFAVGMRYNQGLGNYINLQVSPNLPNVIDRNRALQFYLRYNLWEKL